jgi:predicted GIY-YIG superfamily endonuclease
MVWYVYIAEARTGAFYVGITTNVTERIEKHNRGDGSRMAMQQGPFILRYQSPPFQSKSEARTREAQIKGWSRAKKQKLIKGEWN